MSDENGKLTSEVNRLARAIERYVDTASQRDSRTADLIAKLEVIANELKQLTSKPHRTWKVRALSFLRQLVKPSGLWRLLGLLALLVGFLASLYDLHSKVSVSVGDSLNSDNVLETLLVVSNDGLLPIFNVSFRCSLGIVSSDPNVSSHWPDWRKAQYSFGANLSSDRNVAPIIRAGQKAEANDFCPIGGVIRYADVLLKVRYREYGFPIQERNFRLITIKDSTGRLIWMQQPY